MKNLLVMAFVIAGFITQASGNEAEKIRETKELIESGKFKFEAQSLFSSTFGHNNISYGYELELTNDSAYSYLPFMGEAYSSDFNGESGIKFSEPVENYTLEEKKKGGYIIKFKVDADKENYKMYLDVSETGYASLRVISLYKEGISFNGIIDEIEDKN